MALKRWSVHKKALQMSSERSRCTYTALYTNRFKRLLQINPFEKCLQCSIGKEFFALLYIWCCEEDCESVFIREMSCYGMEWLVCFTHTIRTTNGQLGQINQRGLGKKWVETTQLFLFLTYLYMTETIKVWIEAYRSIDVHKWCSQWLLKEVCEFIMWKI